MPKYSIVIPVYNAEDVIQQCVDSILMQSFKDYEVFLIDDCSRDNSLSLCKEYEADNPSFKVLRQKQNKGVSSARNLGIDHAQGEYILFIDSDDFVNLDYLEIIDKMLLHHNYDLLAFGHYDCVISKDGKVRITTSALNCSFDVQNPTAREWEMFFLQSFFASPWNKVFRLDILREKNIRFDTGCVCYEDYLFNIEYCKWVSNFKVVDTPLYYYRQNEQVVPSLKRKWGQRFAISQKVAEATDSFILRQDAGLDSIRRYSYMAYMIELQYIYISNQSTFFEAVVEMCNDTKFQKAVWSIMPAGKFINLLRFAMKFNLRRMAAWLLRYMVRRI